MLKVPVLSSCAVCRGIKQVFTCFFALCLPPPSTCNYTSNELMYHKSASERSGETEAEWAGGSRGWGGSGDR